MCKYLFFFSLFILACNNKTITPRSDNVVGKWQVQRLFSDNEIVLDRDDTTVHIVRNITLLKKNHPNYTKDDSIKIVARSKDYQKAVAQLYVIFYENGFCKMNDYDSLWKLTEATGNFDIMKRNNDTIILCKSKIGEQRIYSFKHSCLYTTLNEEHFTYFELKKIP